MSEKADEFLDGVAKKTVIVNYRWRFSTYWERLLGLSREWTLSIPVPLIYYLHYAVADRPYDHSGWASMVRDPYSEPLLRFVVEWINSAAYRNGFTEKDKVEFTAAFVQSLPYVPDRVSASMDEYPKYPAETLITNGGDCDDKSILGAALFRKMGYRVALIVLPHAGHAAVGLAGPFSGSYYEVKGVRYFYLETTGEGFGVGQVPPGITDTRAYVYPVD
ncbi:hypothetical protein [Candidatus Methanodesulfokora washburnensis]|uniref:Transglutaminase domain-containing protein n=1 Tax=Candidatus Methanodesulfokora washburnensis TaxID=2478471 RepID=A0A3R9QK17_9CREN|nr:hypothetical protein [Candidatus Methanodesulfokores washburnensis]RSN78400.1 hypothetical protein D6D85_01040 [Candidatus Methanodesulfokores washburnensis]